MQITKIKKSYKYFEATLKLHRLRNLNPDNL